MIKDKIEDLRERLKDRNLIKVAQGSGANYQTIRRFYLGKDISFDSLDMIDRYIHEQSRP